MISQSTRHLLLIEPSVFYSNPETQETNPYQVTETENKNEVFQGALKEFRAFRDNLVEKGVYVTTLKGYPDCPDHIFPNWVSTHPDRRMVFYPMLNPNRQAERKPQILSFLQKHYTLALDMRDEEKKDRFLESTGSLVLDHVNNIAYAALSPRTTESLFLEWTKAMDFEPVAFDTRSHIGEPIYHTDLVMFIGTDFAAIGTETIPDPAQRSKVIEKLSQHREVIELTADQIKHFCGNSLEIVGADNEKYLVMSAAAQSKLTDDQKAFFLSHVKDIIGTDIPTIEKYGGGSARCLIMELH